MKILSDEVKEILMEYKDSEIFLEEAAQRICQQVRELLDGIENPYDARSYEVVPEYMQEGFNRAIQTIKALLEE